MRALALAAALGLATPALAQLPQPAWRPQDLEWQQQQEALRQQMIQQQNQLMALEAQMRAHQAMEDIQAQKQSPRLPQPAISEGVAVPSIDVRALASIPDSVLADSNRKVLEASRNRR